MEHHPPVYINLEDRTDDIIGNHQQQNQHKQTQLIMNGVDDSLGLQNLHGLPPPDGDINNIDTKQNETTIRLYSQMRQLYNENNFVEIMFLLPHISQLNIIPPIFHLIIGCTMVHFGRLTSGFREIGVAICLAPNEIDRKEFITVLAYTYADLNDRDSAMGCLGEILDISRRNLTGPKQFDEMKADICQLERNLLNKLELTKLNKYVKGIVGNLSKSRRGGFSIFIITNNSPSRQPTNGKCKSFDDQVLDLIALNKFFPKDSFTGKCQIIIGKINHADILLQKWDKERKLLKSNPLKLLVEAILVLGPSIAYYGMLKLEPIMNQYFEFIENQAKTNNAGGNKSPKTRTVSAFFLGGLTPINGGSSINGGISSVANGSGGNGAAAAGDIRAISSGNVYNSTFQQTKIIKGFIAMLRHEYKEAFELFIEAEDEKSDYYNHVLILKYICQSNEPQQHRKDLELLVDKIIRLSFVSTFKFHTLAKIYQRLYILEQTSRHSRRSILKKSTCPNYHDLSMKFFLSAAAFAQDDDLYITQYYDNILNFLISGKGSYDCDEKDGQVHIPTVAFFYQVRNYFCLKSDYNYLYIPGLVGDWQEIKYDTKLKLKIEKYLDPEATESKTVSPASGDNFKRSTRVVDMIGYWEKEYLKFKGELPDTIKQFLKKE
ncbi:hypothetical protein CANMA_003625 [Candida margitis]|uniref:uncharacterized protein n=1 Tax=Candida margitis TaxID=1775924 RepID=UPI002227386C|nr:uncharacterized protein CANMA_003625 [Candida margitis]KAI5962850.1 hypothetical protein CANMA_003625 [Candida margitis]